MDPVVDGRGRKPLEGASNREVGVKPGGPGARADSAAARHASERPMFDETLMEEAVSYTHLTLPTILLV